jgi:alkanesulfonate monooxygenase SsuD/methylene tetrahydromethanopterin reductase-like flavin-dependent oxidoreductase (luciferase family)
VPPDASAAPAHRAPAPGDPSLGLVLPTFPQTSGVPASAAGLADTCARAERAGAGALWACDHLFWHGPSLEALAAVGVAASATTHALVGTCVLQLPLRHVPSVAKQAASLSHLASGRLVLGVGVGTHAGEYRAAGEDFATRGARLDAGIDALRAAWAPDEAQGYAQLPAPASLPVWIGGSSEVALRRAARRGDGWIPLFLGPGEYADAMERLDKEAERAGRHGAAVARAAVAFVSVGGSDAGERGLAWMGSLYGLPARSFARHLVAGDARSCARALSRFAEAGAAHVAAFVTCDDPLVPFEDLAGEFAGLVACNAMSPAPLVGSGEPPPDPSERPTVPVRR